MTRDYPPCRIQSDTSGMRSTHLMGHQAGTNRGTGPGRMWGSFSLSSHQECVVLCQTGQWYWCTGPSTYLHLQPTRWALDHKIYNIWCPTAVEHHRQMLVQLEKDLLVHAATVQQLSASQQCTLETLELSQPHTEAYVYWIGKIHSKWIPQLWPKLVDMP